MSALAGRNLIRNFLFSCVLADSLSQAAMPEDGPLELDVRIVWYMNGNIHLGDGPATEFRDGRKL